MAFQTTIDMIEKYAIDCFTKHHNKHQLDFKTKEEMDEWGWDEFYEYICLIGDVDTDEWGGFFDEHLKEINVKEMREYCEGEEFGIDFSTNEEEEMYDSEELMVFSAFINCYMMDEDNQNSLTETLKEIYESFSVELK